MVGLLAVAITALFAFTAPSALAVFVNTASSSGPGTANGQLKSPGRTVVEQSTGNLFVVDSGNNRVQVFSPDTRGFLEYLTQFGSTELSAPWGIAIDEDAGQTYLYVADAGNEEIVKYDSDEAATPTFTVDSDFNSPSKGAGAGQIGNFHAALAIDPSTHELLVADNANKAIKRFEADGTPNGSFDGAAGAGSPGAFDGPIDVAVNSTGDVYVIDANGNIANNEGTSQALRYSPLGEYKATLGPVGTHERVATVTVDSETDEVFVSGDQDAVYEAGPPPFVAALQLFDSANSPLPSPTPSAGAQYDTVSGLAIASGPTFRYYAVFDYGYYFGTAYGRPAIQSYEDLAPPTATVASADSIAPFSATLNGAVNPEGNATACRFTYSTDTSFSESVPCVENPGSGTSPVSVHADITGLSTDTTYHFRLVAVKAGGALSATSGEETLTTAHAEIPAVTFASPGSLTATSAHLSGTVDPLGNPTTYRFEYQRQGDADWSAVLDGSGSAGSGNGPVAEEADLEGLEPNVAYRVRLTATNGAGTIESSPQDFTTDTAVPAVGTISPAQVDDTEATLRGRVNPNNQTTTFRFEFGETAAYGRILPTGAEPSAGDGGSFVIASVVADALAPSTTYHYRVVASNATGSVQGADHTFTTAAPASACANETLRAENSSLKLPDCRAYEMVTPPEKANGRGTSTVGVRGENVATTAVSRDGERVVAMIGLGEFSESASASWLSDRLDLERQSTGWDAKPMASVPNYNRLGEGTSEMALLSASDDFEVQAWGTIQNHFFPQMASWPAGIKTATLRTGHAGAWSLLGPTAPEQQGGEAGPAAHVSPDGEVTAWWGGYRGVLGSVDPSLDQVSGDTAYDYYGGANHLLAACTGEGAERTVVPGISADPTPLQAAAICPLPAPSRDAALVSSQGASLTGSSTAVSGDGSRVYFTAPDPEEATSSPPTGCTGSGATLFCPAQIYLRQLNDDGVRTVRWISRSTVPGQAASLMALARFEGASRDGHTIYFTTRAPLTPDDPNGTGVAPVTIGEPSNLSWDLYRYQLPDDPNADPADGTLVRISAGPTGDADPNTFSTEGSNRASVRHVSRDGSRVYFITASPLPGVAAPSDGTITTPGGAPDGRAMANLYVYDASKPAASSYEFIARIPREIGLASQEEMTCATGGRRQLPPMEKGGQSSSLAVSCVRGNSDGSTIAFMTPARLTSDDAEDDVIDIYVFDEDSDLLSLASKSQGVSGGAPYECGEEWFGPEFCNADMGRGNFAAIEPAQLNVTEDGSVLFESSRQLTPEKVNGDVFDVYRWRDGELSLLSPGTTDDDAYYSGNSADGRDVFINTTQAINPRDIDAEPDIYDARINGGFAVPRPVAPCSGEACQGAPQTAPASVPPPSLTLNGAGNASGKRAKPPKKCAKGKVRKGKKCVAKKKGKGKQHAKRANRETRRVGR